MSEHVQDVTSAASDVYAPPQATKVASGDEPHQLGLQAIARSRRRSAWGLIVGGSAFVLGPLSFFFTDFPFGAAILFAVATALFILSAGHGILALFRLPKGETQRMDAFQMAFSGVFMAFIGFLFTSMATIAFARGRQIRRLGRVILPPIEDSDAWAKLPLQLDAAPDVRDALAARWRWNGQTEHASVAAFAQLTLDLMALGAPPSLIYAANRDAKDEIRHAELCFSLARAIDGRDESPGAFPQVQRSRVLPQVRTLALARLAVDSLVDGALHEGVSARIIARLAKQCSEPTIRAVLTEIAADEGRHAAHGWDVVEWCLAEGGEPVASALRGAIEALPTKVDPDLPEAARSGAWEPYGIHSAAMEAEEHAKAREQLVRRVCELTTVRQAA